MKEWFFSWIFPWIPKRLLSRTIGWIMRWPLIGPFRRPALFLFARAFQINVDEAEWPLSHYRTLDDFFTRRLKSGLRPIEGDFIHPVDGCVTDMGVISQGQLLQAKKWDYSLAEFLGDAELAKAYEGGQFMTYYLCPTDYHRVHAPRSGRLVSARHIPGLLWPVNEWSVNNIRRLFCLNERVVLNFEGAQGRFSVVLVGATNVGRITISLDPSITTNRWMWHAPTDRTYSPPMEIPVGSEIGIFHLGSTVICLYESSWPRARTQLPRATVRMGQAAI